MRSRILYESRPLECWRRAKEIREQYNHQVWAAKDEDSLLVGMFGSGLTSLLAGLGSWKYVNLAQLSAEVAVNKDQAIKCAQAWEAQGYARDMCADIRISCGAMFLDYSGHGGWPKLDFFFQLDSCDLLSGGATVVSEQLGIPYFAVDYPGNLGQDVKPSYIDYFAAELYDAIDWMQKITGRDYDDERLIEAVRNEFRSATLWGKVWQLNQAIPAPLSQRMMLSLSFPMLALPHSKETVQFCEMLLHEVQSRVQDKIAALPAERCRLLHEMRQPHYFPMSRYVEKYGALFVGSRFDLLRGTGGFVTRSDGLWELAATPEEMGTEINSRESAIRSLATWYLTTRSLRCLQASMKVNELVQVVKDWHADGVVMHQNRGCPKLAAGLIDGKRELQERGIPTLIYEANDLDPREFSEADVSNRLDAFLESLGLSRLGD